MKRTICIALALVMIFALTISVAAKESPTPKDYLSVTTATDPSDGSLGTAATSKDKVATDATGEDAQVTLTATQTKGFFAHWVIEGTYDTVTGDENSAELTIIPKTDIHAIAVFTIEEGYYTMTVSVIGDGTATVDPVKVKIGSNGTATFTAVDGKDKFVDWTLECVYDVVEGSSTSKTLVIRPYSDVHGIAKFMGDSSSSTPASSSKSSSGSNQSGTSPKTGDPLFVVIGLAVLALGAGALAVKKIKE